MPDARSMGFRAVTPPRGPSNALANIHGLIRKWAANRHMTILSTHHAVLDAPRKDIYTIDYILQVMLVNQGSHN